MIADPTCRFSSRVENYVRYRPDYPPAVLEVIRAKCGFTPSDVVADVGSGTGIFSELLLKNGNHVYGVEPDAGMRAAAERLLANYLHFNSVAGTAEQTMLPSQSVSFVTAAQAFHWFDRERSRPELLRILRPGGWLVLIWNVRRLDTTTFLRAYESLLETYGTDYAAVRDQHPGTSEVRAFVGDARFELTTLAHRQHFDFEGLRGRLMSSSYAPEPGHNNHEPMLERLAQIFEETQEDGQVSFDYDTQIYTSQVAPP